MSDVVPLNKDYDMYVSFMSSYHMKSRRSARDRSIPRSLQKPEFLEILLDLTADVFNILYITRRLTPSGPPSRFGDKLLGIRVKSVPKTGVSAVLQGLVLLGHQSGKVTKGDDDYSKHRLRAVHTYCARSGPTGLLIKVN